MSFEMFKKITSMLSPSQPIGVTPKKDNNYIEGAAQQTAKTEMSTANTANQKAQAINNISKDISSVAKTALIMDIEYSSNISNNLLSQARNSHDNASNIIKSSNNPDVISNASATNSATLLGLQKASKNLLPYQRESIERAVHQYGQAGIQQATLKNAEIHSDNYLNTSINGRNAQLATWSTTLANTDDPKVRKKVFNEVATEQQNLENTRQFLTTKSQLTKLDSLEGNLRSAYVVMLKPKPQYENTNITEQIQHNSTIVTKRSVASDEGVDNVYHGGQVNTFNESSVGANPDYLNIHNQKVEAKGYMAVYANSPHLMESLLTAKNNGGYIAKHGADIYINMIKTGQADKLASILNPNIKELQNKVGESTTPQEYTENNKNYQQSIKSFMDQKELSSNSYDPMPTQLKNDMHATMNVEQTPENSQELYHRANTTFKVCGDKNKTLFGSSPADNACRQVRYQESDKNGNLTYPQDGLDILKSYSPDVQKKLAGDTDVFTANPGNTKLRYINPIGTQTTIKNYAEIGDYISQNASSFGINQMSILTGNSSDSISKSTQARIFMKMQGGMSMDDATISVKSDNTQILLNTPVNNGTTSNGGSFSISPSVGNAYGLQDVDPSGMDGVISNLSSTLYNNRIHGMNLVTNKYSDDDKLNASDKVVSNLRSNKQVLGDEDNTHIYSSNGRMYMKYENGATYPISAHQIELEVDKYKAKKVSDAKTTSKIDKATSNYTSNMGLPESARNFM